MSNLEARIGRHVTDRLTGEITDSVRTALDHGLSPKEFVSLVQESWSLELYDRGKNDNASFNQLLGNMQD